MANITYCTCDREKQHQIIDCNFFVRKSIALPSLLYGTNIINLTDDNIRELHKIENSVLSSPCIIRYRV